MNEFEEGFMAGMLLGKSSKKSDSGGGNYDYIKDALFRYILESGKLVGTCQWGNDYTVKAYVGAFKKFDTNANLFYHVLADKYFSEADLITSSGFLGETATKRYGTPLARSKTNADGIFTYVSYVFFKGDKPLYGDVNIPEYAESSLNSYYIYTDNNGTWYPGHTIKDIVFVPYQTYSLSEGYLDNISYVGDFERYYKLTLDTSSTVTHDGEIYPVEKIKSYLDTRNANGESSSGGSVSVPYQSAYTKVEWHKCQWTNPDTGETSTIDDQTRPPVFTKGDVNDRNFSVSIWFYNLPKIRLLGDTPVSQIEKEIINAHDQMIKKAEGDTGYITEIKIGSFVDPT